jgi:hypothetical protein
MHEVITELFTVLFNTDWSSIGEHIVFQKLFKTYVISHLTTHLVLHLMCHCRNMPEDGELILPLKHCILIIILILIYKTKEKVPKVIPWAIPSSEPYGIINNWLNLSLVNHNVYDVYMTVQLQDTSVCSGQDYERFFRRKLKFRIIVYKM